MLNHLSWTSYLESAILLLVIYYAIIGARFYAYDLSRLFRPGLVKNQPAQSLPAALVYEGPKNEEMDFKLPGHPDPDNLPDDSITEADNIIRSLKECVSAASIKPYAPAALIPQIQKIFKEHAALKKSRHRPAINELVVAECERTGTALLTDDEVDQWWGD
jgi:hypothetical protein